MNTNRDTEIKIFKDIYSLMRKYNVYTKFRDGYNFYADMGKLRKKYLGGNDKTKTV